MARVTVEDCLNAVNNRFQLIHLAAKRVEQLRRGAVPQVVAPKNKEVVLALREVAARKVLPAAPGEELPPIEYYEPEPLDFDDEDYTELEAEVEAPAEAPAVLTAGPKGEPEGE